MTLDTYGHILAGSQATLAKRLDQMFEEDRMSDVGTAPQESRS
jgi:hypothetical protein